jgi:hypothetical protein
MQRAAAIFEKKYGAEHPKTQESRLLVSVADGFVPLCFFFSLAVQAEKFSEVVKEASGQEVTGKAVGGAKKTVQAK